MPHRIRHCKVCNTGWCASAKPEERIDWLLKENARLTAVVARYAVFVERVRDEVDVLNEDVQP